MKQIKSFLSKIAMFLFLCGMWTAAVILGTIYIIAH